MLSIKHTKLLYFTTFLGLAKLCQSHSYDPYSKYNPNHPYSSDWNDTHPGQFNPDDPCGTGKPRVTDTERLIKDVVSWVIMAALLFVSFTLGCGTNFTVLKDVFKRPVGIILGIICQFGIMPAFGYLLTEILPEFPQYPKLAVLIMASCPGGSLSNVVSFWIGGDITLSVSMSTVSATLGLGFVPLLMYLYGTTFDVAIDVPYGEIATIVASLAIPVFFGMLIKWKFPEFADRCVSIGGIIGIVATAASAITLTAIYAKTWVIIWQFFVVAALLPVGGFIMGYLFTKLASYIPGLKQTEAQARTVATETGIQNVQLATGIINIAPTFSSKPCIQAEMAVMPLMYLMSQMIWSFLLIAAIRAIKSNPCKKGKEGDLDITHEIERRDTLRQEDLEKDLDVFQKVNRNRIMSVVAGVGGGFIPVLGDGDNELLLKEKANKISALNREMEGEGSIVGKSGGNVNFASTEE